MTSIEILAVIATAFAQKKAAILTIGSTPFDAVDIELDPSAIMSAEVKEENNIAKILSAPDLETAIRYTGKNISPEEESALNQVRERLKPQLLATRESRMKAAVAAHLATRRSKLTVDEVFSFMCENLFGEEKLPQAINNEQEIIFTNKIEEYTQKLEEVSF